MSNVDLKFGHMTCTSLHTLNMRICFVYLSFLNGVLQRSSRLLFAASAIPHRWWACCIYSGWKSTTSDTSTPVYTHAKATTTTVANRHPGIWQCCQLPVCLRVKKNVFILLLFDTTVGTPLETLSMRYCRPSSPVTPFECCNKTYHRLSSSIMDFVTACGWPEIVIKMFANNNRWQQLYCWPCNNNVAILLQRQQYGCCQRRTYDLDGDYCSIGWFLWTLPSSWHRLAAILCRRYAHSTYSDRCLFVCQPCILTKRCQVGHMCVCIA